MKKIQRLLFLLSFGFSCLFANQSDPAYDLLMLFDDLSPALVSETKLPVIITDFGKTDFQFSKDMKLLSVQISPTSKKDLKKLHQYIRDSYKTLYIDTDTLKTWIKNGIRMDLDLRNEMGRLLISKAVFDGNNKLDLPPDVLILDAIKANVYNDYHSQNVFILGHRNEERQLFSNPVWLYTDEGDGVEEMIFALPTPHDGGYDYKLTAISSSAIQLEADTTSFSYLLITSETGGSGGIQNALVMDVRLKYPKPILNSDSFTLLDFTGEYLPGYKALLRFTEKDSTILSLKKRKKILHEAKVYQDGQLLQKVELWGNFFVGTAYLPVNKQNNKSSLVIYQEVRGFANIDRIALIETHLSLKGSEWIVTKKKIKAY